MLGYEYPSQRREMRVLECQKITAEYLEGI